MDTLVSRFEQIVKAHSDHPALVCDAETLSYRELHRRAMHVAQAVRRWYWTEKARPVSPTDVIGICIEKCPDLYVAILGTLTAGASYVPLDPELSRDAQQFIVDSCACQLVLTGDEKTAVPDRCTALVVRQHVADHDPDDAAQSTVSLIPTDLCYTIFTSGSTGRPKGVMVNHGNVINLVDWAVGEFAMTSASRALQYSTINFDASILDIFPALLTGAALCIPTTAQRLSARALADFCRRHGVDQAFLPPSLLAVLEPDAFGTISTLLTGGEACSPHVARSWAPGRRFYNLYGPTECTVLATCKRMDAQTSPKNLGQAITGVRLHVLDEDGKPASRGELHIAGLAVSPGYVGDAAATADRYVRIGSLDASILYKTGDIVELDDAGELHFLGRKDRQVKVRGYRIELEEIEGAIHALGYREVALKLSRTGALVAYLTSDEPVEANALKASLAQTLSSYKIPQHVVQLPRLPYKSNGKVDYQLLPDFEPTRPEGNTATTLDDRYAPLGELWARELSIDAGSLEPHSNFRDLGGSSINIVHLLSAVESRFGASVDFIDFFNNPTIEFLFQFLNQRQNKPC